jgi:hypothetical protein
MSLAGRIRWAVIAWLNDLRFDALPGRRLPALVPGHYAYAGVRGVLRLGQAWLLHRFPSISSRVGFRARNCPCCG